MLTPEFSQALFRDDVHFGSRDLVPSIHEFSQIAKLNAS
jgi:hypothetical protein